MTMKTERLWFPPNSFGTVAHWAVETLRVDGSWRVYTEHASSTAAAAQAQRMKDRWPNSQLRIIAVG
jgi:hypothetical protein